MSDVCKCPHDKKIDRLEATVFGHNNGSPGLKEIVSKLDGTVKIFAENTQHLTTAVSGLAKTVSEMKGEENIKQSYKNKSRWLIGLMITIVIFSITTIIALITSA